MPTINRGDDYFQAVTYTGNGSTNTITGLRFQPDFVWVKGRSGATDHALYDSVRGTTKDLVSNSTAAETTQATGLTAFNSDGFTLGALAKMNTNAATYVAWCWKAGQGSTSSNTSGSITSTVSVNATAGFSIVSWTANGSVSTVGHGLGVAPKIVINRQRGVGDWAFITDLLTVGTPQYMYLNTTQAIANTGWGSSPTSSVISAYSYGSGQTIISYCWAEIPGFSKFGSYTGNGSADGPFVYTGFRPKFIMCKRTNTTGDWVINDTSRNTTNVVNLWLYANVTDADTTFAFCDIVSNGFKIRVGPTAMNNSSDSYIFMAFAENPLKNSLAR